MTNGEYAERGALAVCDYAGVCNPDDRDIANLIADIGRFSDREGHNFRAIVRRAIRNGREERRARGLGMGSSGPGCGKPAEKWRLFPLDPVLPVCEPAAIMNVSEKHFSFACPASMNGRHRQRPIPYQSSTCASSIVPITYPRWS